MRGNQVLLQGKGGRDGAEVRNSKDSHRQSWDLLIKQLREGEDERKEKVR